MARPRHIPEFESKISYPFPVLPDGVYECDETMFQERFVGRFPASTTRQEICAGFLRLRAEVANNGLSATQWVDGSFVEGKPDPVDVDVVSFCDYDSLNQLVADTAQAAVQLLNGRESTKVNYHTHTFLVPSCPPGHAYHSVFEMWRRYWRNWLGRTREIPNPPGPNLPGYRKGFLEMTLGAAAPAIDSGRSVP